MPWHVTRLRDRLSVVWRWLGAACLAAALPLAPQAGAQTGAALIIRNDPGGLLGARSAELRRLRASGQRVELRGSCYSACTMYLGLPNVCIAPGARLGFHGPSWYGADLPPDRFEHWSQVIARNYREPLRSWFLGEARYKTRDYIVLSGAELIRMGYPRC